MEPSILTGQLLMAKQLSLMPSSGSEMIGIAEQGNNRECMAVQYPLASCPVVLALRNHVCCEFGD